MHAPDAPSSTPSEPSVVGASSQRYTLDAKIASGGIATVYRGRGASALGFERPVAIKVCHPHLVDGPGRAAAFLEEARIAARIRHPHVVATLDVIATDGGVSIVMEYVEGRTVAELIRAAGRNDAPISVGVAARIVADALLGLHAAHELRDDEGRPMDLVHRDVSPQNVLVSVDGFAKVADFGVFKARGREAPSTEVGALKGKLGYVAPEVYLGKAPVTRAADVFAAGVVLWELVAGRRLFGDETHAGVMHAVLHGEPPPLSSLRSDVPASLEAIVARALALDPAQRFPSADAFACALEPFASSARDVAAVVRAGTTPVGADAPSAPREEIPPEPATPHECVTPVSVARARRSWELWALAAAALVVFVSTFVTTRAFVASRGDPSPVLGTAVVTHAVIATETASSAPAPATPTLPAVAGSSPPARASIVRQPRPTPKVAPTPRAAATSVPRVAATVFDPETP